MEEEFQIADQQIEDPKQKLYNSLQKRGYYTKSFDEFKKQYSSPESIDKIYSVVSRDGLYTKSKDDFYGQYFGDLKKKGGTAPSKVGGEVGTSVPQLDENDQVKAFLEPHREQYQLSTGRLLNQPQGGDIQGMRQPIPRTINEAKEQQNPQVTTRQEQASAAKNLDIATQVVKNNVFKNGNDAQKALDKLGNKFNPNNETHQLAKEKADEFEKIKNDVYGDGTGSIEAAALKEKLESDHNFHQKFINLYKDGNDLSQEEKGTMISEYVARHKNDLEELSKENPDIKTDYEDVTKNIVNRLPDYGKMSIAQEITNEREKRNLNSSIVNFNTSTASKHNSQIANDILTPEQKKFYDENKDEIDSKIVKGGFFNNLANIKDLPKGTQQLVEHFTVGDNQSKGEQAYSELTPKVIDPSKGWKQVAGTLGDLTSKLAYMALISKGLGAAGISGGVASKLAVPLSMGNDILNESKDEFNGDETKANVSALLKIGLMTFLNPLHADKATEAVNIILSKAADGEAAATLRGKLIKGIMGAGEEVSKATAQNFTYSQAANIVDNALGFNNYHEGEGAEALKQGAIMGLIPGVLKGVSEVAKRPTETPAPKEELSQPIPEQKVEEQSHEQKVIQQAIDNGEVKGGNKMMAEAAMQSPETAKQFIKEVSYQVNNKVASHVGAPTEDALKQTYGETLVNHVKEEPKLTIEEPKSKIKELQSQKEQLIKERDNPPTKEVPVYDKYTGKESGKEVQELSKEELKDHKEKLNKEISAIDEKIDTQKKEILEKKPKLDELPFIKAKEFISAKDSERMDELGEKHDAIKEKFINLRKISECIWAI